jgi:hypothetical protein
MNTKGNLALAVHFDRGRERHGGSRAGGQNAARLSHRGDRGNRPRRLSELRRKGSGNAGAFQGQFPLCRPWRQDSGSRGPTAEEHCGARVRQHREGSCLV